MKIFVDENIPSRTVEELRGLGHDVLDICGTSDQGIDDDKLWARMLNERRLLIRLTRGLRNTGGESHPGVLIVRLRQPNEAKIHERVMRALRQFSESEWPGATAQRGFSADGDSSRGAGAVSGRAGSRTRGPTARLANLGRGRGRAESGFGGEVRRFRRC